MRPLLLNYTELRGGAARAANRLHRALRSAGVESTMLVQIRDTDDYTVLGPRSNLERFLGLVRPAVDLLPILAYRHRTKGTYYPGWLPSSITSRVAAIAPDVVHLHWVAGGYVTPHGISRLRAPLVWTLHDMWAFTGGCHYDDGCGKFTERCGACPALGSKRRHDLSWWNWRRKMKNFTGLRGVIITPSRWLAEQARRSAVLGKQMVRVIPNAVDTARFRPMPRAQARDWLGLPADRTVVLFGAANPNSEPRKGFKYLQAALSEFAATRPQRAPMAVVLGAEAPRKPPDVGMELRYMGSLNDDAALALLYCAADVFVAPSTQENLSNMVVESLSCGTPVVAFSIGGMPDMIEHRVNGYLASAFDTSDLAAGIEWAVAEQRRAELSAAARSSAVSRYEQQRVAQAHIEVYREAMELAASGPKTNDAA